MTHEAQPPPGLQGAESLATDVPPEVCPNVRLACSLLWWSLGVAGFGLLMDILWPTEPLTRIAAFFAGAIGAALGIVLTSWGTRKLEAGRNWMRLLITTAQIGGLALIPVFWDFFAPILHWQYVERPFHGVIDVVQFTLIFSAVALMNTSSARAWFKVQQRGAQSVA